MSIRRTRAALCACALAGALVAAVPGASVAAPDPSIPVGDRPLNVAFSPDGAQAYVTNNGDGTLSVIDTATGTVVDTIPTSLRPFTVTVSPAAPLRVYVAATGDGTPPSLDIIDPVTRTVSAQSGPLGNPSGVAADGSFVYVTNATGQFTRFPAAGGLAQGCELQTPTRGVALVGDQAFVSLFSLSGVQVIDTTAFACAAPPPPPPPTIAVGDGPWGVTYNPVRDELYVGNSDSSTVSVIDPATSTVIATLPVGPGSRSIAVSPDGDRVYVTTATGALDVLNRAIPARSGTAPVNPSSEGVAASPDGRLVYVTDAADDTVLPFVRPTVTAPVDTSVVEGTAATFTVATTGDVTAVSWETSRDGVTWTPVPGSTGTTLTLNPALADSGLRVRAVAQSVVFAWITSASAVLTVTPAPPTPTPTPTPAPSPSAAPELSATGGSSDRLAGLAGMLVVLGAGALLLARRRRA